jgi:hypothetical protein
MTRTHDTTARPAAAPASLRLLELVMGSWRAGVISAFAELGVADAFRAESLSADQVACRLGLEAQMAVRFCAASRAVGLLEEASGETLMLTDLGRALATDARDSMRNFARWSGSTADRSTWSHLPTAVRTGRSPFAAVHGSGVWDFFDSHPDTAVVFDSAMTELSRHVIRPVVEAVDFSRFTSLTDVGGGRGALLSAVLAVQPHLRGVLFDQPDVVARAPRVLQDAGVADRVEVVPGSFFDGVPAGTDLYLLSNVLHDWDDAHARVILRNVAAAMSPGDSIAIVEAVVGVDPRFDEAIALMDMDMLVLCDGKQRSVEDFRRLLAELRIEVTGVRSAGLQSVIEGLKVD